MVLELVGLAFAALVVFQLVFKKYVTVHGAHDKSEDEKYYWTSCLVYASVAVVSFYYAQVLA
jgi:hypothetical protein